MKSEPKIIKPCQGDTTEIRYCRPMKRDLERRNYPVLVLQGASENSRDVIVRTERFVLGRGSTADCRLQDGGVSRVHASIHYVNHDQSNENPICMLEDCGSKNGTFLNGKRVEEPVELCNMDQIFIGNTTYYYTVRFEENLEKRQFVMTDSLTGFVSRNQLEVMFEREFDRSLRYAQKLSLVIFDIDRLSEINETYGREFGDYVLEQFAEILKHRIRRHDLAGRFDGDAFYVMLPHTNQGGAEVLAEQLRFLVMVNRFSQDDTSMKVTVSVGITEIDHEGKDSFEAMMARGKKALDVAKSEGRNRVSYS